MNGVEALHQDYRQLQETHGFRVKQTIGSPQHVKIAMKSLLKNNLRAVGFPYCFQNFPSLEDAQNPDPLPLFLTRFIDTIKEHIKKKEQEISHQVSSR